MYKYICKSSNFFPSTYTNIILYYIFHTGTSPITYGSLSEGKYHIVVPAKCACVTRQDVEHYKFQIEYIKILDLLQIILYTNIIAKSIKLAVATFYLAVAVATLSYSGPAMYIKRFFYIAT